MRTLWRLAYLWLWACLAWLPAQGQETGWIHCSVPGFDVYSDESEAVTRRRLSYLLLAIADLQRVWPTPQFKSYPTGTILFCSHPERYTRVLPKFESTFISTHLPTDIFFNTKFSAAEEFNREWGAGRHGNPTGPGQLTFDPPVIDSWGSHLLQRHYSAYFQPLLGEREMPWLIYGTAKLIQSMVCEANGITLPPLTSDDTLPTRTATHGSGESLRSALGKREVQPLSQLFSAEKIPPLLWERRDFGKRPRFPTSQNGRNLVGPGNQGFEHLVQCNRFLDEAYEVVRFGLFGDNGKHRLAFIRFAEASANGPLDEASFAKLLGMDESSFLRAVWQDVSIGQTCRLTFQIPGNPHPEAQLRFTPVSPAALVEVESKWSASRGEKAGAGRRWVEQNNVQVLEEEMFFIDSLF